MDMQTLFFGLWAILAFCIGSSKDLLDSMIDIVVSFFIALILVSAYSGLKDII
jgi:hypothetical protein